MSALAALKPEFQHQRKQLRQHLRVRRRALPKNQQHYAAKQLAQHLLALPGMARLRHIGAYMACDGEINPWLFWQAKQRQGARIYMPVLHAHAPHGVRFLRVSHTASIAKRRAVCVRGHWRANLFNIAEPRSRHHRAAWTLDALLIPLVGFDRQGNRLGMGGGFYDRLLADCQRRPRHPRLIAIAHACQEVAQLPVASWDQPVDWIVTDSGRVR